MITNDAALATALNGRIDRPVVGPFAVTPKMIAGMVGPEIMDRPVLRDLRVISEVADETGYDFRYVHSEIENIREIRKYTQNVDKHLYTRKAHRVCEYYFKEPTQTRIMSEFNPEVHKFFQPYKNIAIINVDLFNDLDKHFIPNGA